MSAAEDVEAVAHAVRSVPLGPLGPTALSIAGTDHFVANFKEAEAIAEAVLAALAPIRAAEQQAARREVLEREASTVTEEMFGGRGNDVHLWLLRRARDLAATHDEGGE